MKTIPASKVIILLGLLIGFAAAPCLAQTDGEHHDIVIPQIKMENVPVPDAIRNLARQAGINFILDPRVNSDPAAPPITINFENISVKEALDRVLKIRRLVLIENPATTVSRIAPENLGIKPVDPELLKNDTNAVIPLILMDDVPLEDALVNLARQIKLKMDFDEKLRTPIQSPLSTQVSIRWNKLTCKQALLALLDNYDLTMVIDPANGTAMVSAKRPPSKSP